MLSSVSQCRVVRWGQRSRDREAVSLFQALSFGSHDDGVTKYSIPQVLIVPVDDPHDRANAIEVARGLAQRLGATVEQVTVVDPDVEVASVEPVTHVFDGVSVTSRMVRAESVDRVLIDRLDDPGALLCIPSSGRTAVVESLAGSTSAALLHHARTPIMVIGPVCVPQFRGTILAIAVDGSSDGETIVEPALDLAVALGLMPMLYQVLPEGTQATIGDAREVSYVARLAARSSRPGVAVQYDVLHDEHPGRGLSRLTDDDSVALVAMSSHGHAPSERLTLPSTAHQLIRHARCPVFLGPRTAPIVAFDHGPRRRVVVGVDGSPVDRAAIAVAVDQAEHRDAAVEIVHAFSQSWYFVEGGMTVRGDSAKDREVAARVMAAAVAHARELSPSIEIVEWMAERLPLDALLEAAIGADLLVVGEHRYNLIERLTLGSNTQAVIRRSPIPVIIVPEWAQVGVSGSAKTSRSI